MMENPEVAGWMQQARRKRAVARLRAALLAGEESYVLVPRDALREVLSGEQAQRDEQFQKALEESWRSGG